MLLYASFQNHFSARDTIRSYYNTFSQISLGEQCFPCHTMKIPDVLDFASCVRGYHVYAAAWTAEISSSIFNVLSGMKQYP